VNPGEINNLREVNYDIVSWEFGQGKEVLTGYLGNMSSRNISIKVIIKLT